MNFGNASELMLVVDGTVVSAAAGAGAEAEPPPS